jgi:hypothetical protein
VQTALDDGTLTEGHARQLLRLEMERVNWQRMVERIVGEKWPVRRLRNWVDYQLLVWTPQWWEVTDTYKDLADYAGRLVNEVRYQYAEREWLKHAKESLKRHEMLAIAFADAGFGSLAEWLLAEMNLACLNAWGKRRHLYREVGVDDSTTVKAVLTWGLDVDEMIWPKGIIEWMDTLPELPNEEPESLAWGEQFWREESGHRAAWFDQVKGLPFDEMKQTPYVPMPRDIGAGAAEGTPEAVGARSEVLA